MRMDKARVQSWRQAGLTETEGVAAEQERSEGNETIEGECRLPSLSSLLFHLPLHLIRASAPFTDTLFVC